MSVKYGFCGIRWVIALPNDLTTQLPNSPLAASTESTRQKSTSVLPHPQPLS